MKTLFAVALMLISGRVILAQPSYAIMPPGNVSASITCRAWSTPLPVTFTASWKTTTKRKHADGLVTTGVSIAKAAQDNGGRTYRETRYSNRSGASHIDGFFVFLFDPFLNAQISWNSGSREAVIFHAPMPAQAAKAAQPATPRTDCERLPAPPSSPSESRVGNLGTKMIHGFEARGTRYNSLIFPSTPGSKEPAVPAIEESWFSQEYGVEVLHIVKYPQGDITTTELEDFESGAPDPTLFEIPAGYAVRDVYQGNAAEHSSNE